MVFSDLEATKDVILSPPASPLSTTAHGGEAEPPPPPLGKQRATTSPPRNGTTTILGNAEFSSGGLVLVYRPISYPCLNELLQFPFLRYRSGRLNSAVIRQHVWES